MTRQEFIEALDHVGNLLDEANLDITHELREAGDDPDIVKASEDQELYDFLDRWDDTYTDFNILYAKVKGEK